jgi:hypothetical protein
LAGPPWHAATQLVKSQLLCSSGSPWNRMSISHSQVRRNAATGKTTNWFRPGSAPICCRRLSRPNGGPLQVPRWGYGSKRKGTVTVTWAETGLPCWRAGS